MDVHLVDGTYELFRHFFAIPQEANAAGEEVAATRGVVRSMLRMIEEGTTHLGVATDHVIESFRNDLWPGYKTGAGIAPALSAQFPLLEEALRALGVTVWAMVELEADDALASAAAVASNDPRVGVAYVCTPDKDLAQCVGGKVVLVDRRHNEVRDETWVRARFGVAPSSIPDYLALVGDAADGYPGLPGWGARSAATVLARFGTIDAVPSQGWDVRIRGAGTLARTLQDRRDQALLFRTLATLRTDADVGVVDDWCWVGPTPAFDEICRRLSDDELGARAAAARAGV